ncbi:Protein CHROMATIN REMODELING 20 [Colletotrichum tanaceti]|uniref:Protein CHROMATIN REMODELING 20 n=1 Tax=Colletotrichum tanaceti TaxID=1306861 RepID=A0A4U6XML4_9PEZI|nr:Protein CHROMATIN REMODELING 20 [Colletotrichum tanaceti]TKW56921.1 Protein CHROMATIN REMODELING 20 [Colletotrichum tanaceti]
MAGQEDDPYEWDVEQVVHELCAEEKRPWHPKLATKRPDPAALSKALVENDIDGETLLTYQDVMSSLDGLARDLGLIKTTHKMTFVKAVNYLKSKSRGYRKFKADLMRPDVETPTNSQEVRLNGDHELAVPAQTTASESQQKPPLVPDDEMQANPGHNSPTTTVLQSQALPTNKPDTEVLDQFNHLRTAQIDGTDREVSEPPQKKRRMAPSLISNDVLGVGNAPILTAADDLAERLYGSKNAHPPDSTTTNSTNTFGDKGTDAPTTERVTKAYFGHKGLITDGRIPKSSLVWNARDEVGGGGNIFNLVTNGSFPNGRRRQVSRAMRRLFRANSKSLAMMQTGQYPYVEPEEEDKILPLFGDSDGEDGYDTETREAIENEEEELLNLKSRHLTKDDVSRVLQEVIQQIENSWDERKLPKKQRKANEIWNKARRRGLVRQIATATSTIGKLTTRIEKICWEIQRDQWPDEEQLRGQARCLECSVEDRKAERWLLDVLRGHEPPRPETIPRPRLIIKKRDVLSDEGGELITSGDDDDDFIMHDEMDFAYSPAPVASRHASPMNLDNLGELLALGSHGSEVPKHESPAGNLVDIQSDTNIIDLTACDSEPLFEKNTGEETGRRVICLDTPEKARPTPTLMPPSLPDSDTEEQPSLTREELETPYSQPERIGAIQPKMWKAALDNSRLLICIIWRLDAQRREAFFRTITSMAPADIWTDFVMTALEDPGDEEQGSTREMGTVIARLFRTYVFGKMVSPSSVAKSMRERKARTVRGKVDRFEGFCDFVKEHVVPHFPEAIQVTGSDSGTPRRNRRRSLDSLNGYSDDEILNSPSKKRKRVVIIDQTAKDIRESDRQRKEEQEKRRAELRKKLAASDTISSDKSRLIINETKEDNQGLIYVNEDIGKRIKDHQIDGVRFMWNQIVYHSKVRQGCLLAHTMGLGKTMQVITLLVAITESAQSQDASIRSQIPDDLRQSKTLVLCPSVLVDNWMDELLMWAPDGLLGRFFKLEAITRPPERGPMIRTWDEEGGVLIVGYDMFKRLIDPPAHDNPPPADAKSVKDILTQSPNLVIADEAHKLKNPESKLSMAAAQFRTQSRIALTGSPLANSVLEFFYMIDWVAPGYLGPLSEFKACYAEPIQAGLYEDSSKSAYRKAKKALAVLEATVAPKTNRATIQSILQDGLPPKKEFVLTVPLTPLQAKLYDSFLESLRKEEIGLGGKILGAVSNFCLIANHPKIFETRLKEERKLLQKSDKANLTLTSQIISEGLKIAKLQKDMSSHVLSWKVQLLVAILDQCEKVGDKVLVFTQSIPTMDYLDSLFRQQRRKIARLDGSTPISLRQQNIKDFNNGDSHLYLISTAAGGTGLNIYGANRVVIFDFKYNPIHEQQAIGRAYRIGQQKQVYVYTFISGGTYEQAMHNKAVFKTQLASRVVDNENPKRWSKKENEYLKNREEPPQQDLSLFAGLDTVLDSLLTHPDLSQGIRSIMMTDTFKEEDTNEILTQEDLKDVKEQVYLNSIRNTDPAKFRQLELERLGRLHAAPSMVGIAAVSQPPYRPLAIPVGSVETPIPLPVLPATAVRNPPYIPAQSASAAVEIVTAAQTPSTTVPPPPPPLEPAGLPNQADENTGTKQQASIQAGPIVASGVENAEQKMADSRIVPPMPMAGANTFFRNQQEPVTPPPAEKLLPSSAKKQAKTKSSIINWPDQFEQKVLESVDKVTDPELLDAIEANKNDLAKRIASSTWHIRSEMNEGFLSDNSHMKRLCSLMENPRFAAAILTGHLPPAQIAHASTEAGLNNIVEELIKLDDKTFQEKYGLRRDSPKQPNV